MPDAFERFVQERSAGLLRTAWMLTGEEALAHDLVQSALMRAWTRWDRIEHRDAAETYVRRVLLTTFLTWRRRRWLSEVPIGLPDDSRASIGDISDAAVLRTAVVASLSRLPKRQRAVLVLRYFDDLSEASTAEALRCSLGTVKTHAARGLARLRADRDLAHIWDGSDDDDQ